MHIAFPILAAPCAALALSSGAAGLFPPVSTLDPALLMPPDSAEIEIAPDGGFLVDGKPRYLLGTILYGTPSAADTVPGPGYSPDDAWIYETIPDRDYLQRLGFDTVGGEVSTTWLREFRPEASFYQARWTTTRPPGRPPASRCGGFCRRGAGPSPLRASQSSSRRCR